MEIEPLLDKFRCLWLSGTHTAVVLSVPIRRTVTFITLLLALTDGDRAGEVESGVQRRGRSRFQRTDADDPNLPRSSPPLLTRRELNTPDGILVLPGK